MRVICHFAQSSLPPASGLAKHPPFGAAQVSVGKTAGAPARCTDAPTDIAVRQTGTRSFHHTLNSAFLLEYAL